MKKSALTLLLVLMALLSLTACRKETKIVHCDRCGDEIVLDADDRITEDWIVFCKTCEEEAFGDNPVVQ